jgi:glucose-6-phosphate dehydrogenase-like protein
VQSDVTVEGTVQTPCGELAVERPARVADPATLVIFGATGDLAKRKLLPALYNLNVDHLLPEGFGVCLPARTPRAHRGQHGRPARWNPIMALTAEYRRLGDARKRSTT